MVFFQPGDDFETIKAAQHSGLGTSDARLTAQEAFERHVKVDTQRFG